MRRWPPTRPWTSSCSAATVRSPPFYEAAGFTRLPGTVLVGGTPEEPLATDAPGFDKEVLADFPGPHTDAAAFTGVRIALYPGLVDRLW